MANDNNIFRNGSVWLKADFHMHTKADKEFKYEGEENQYIQKYIEKLENTNTRIGVVTNHNKFDNDEYKALRKAAGKKGIYLLSGVELSVNDGSNGIHALIVFQYKRWVINNDNYIDQFLNSAFEGISNRENSNTRCKYNLSDLFKKLDEHRKGGRDSFIVMAHIEQNCGFCKELDGGRIMQLAKDEHFKKNVLAFQKLRTNELKSNLVTWFEGENKLPAFIEGSDCKNINEIGGCGKQKDENGSDIVKACYLKIGDFNFEAIKYALIDMDNRLALAKPTIKNAFIQSISFEGGLLSNTVLNFSPELNCFIGIRGSGKSSILEILRYTLGISLGNQASDKDYKNGLIEHVLKSGGKVIVHVVNNHKKEYRIEKIYGQKEDIYENNVRIDVPSIDTVFQTPVYFGQKDLSSKHIDFEADLVKKLIGSRLDTIKSKISQKSAEIEDVISQLKKLENLEELKREIEAGIKATEFRLREFKEKGVEEKLKQQSKFESDISKFNEIISELKNYQNSLYSIINNYHHFFISTSFESDENKDIFEQAEKVFKQLIVEFKNLNGIKQNTDTYIAEFEKLNEHLQEKKDNLKEAFAKIKREIDVPNLSPDDFLKLNRKIETSKLKLVEIDKSEKKKNELNKLLNDKISELNKLWHEEYKILEHEVTRINKYESSLSISVDYKGRKDIFDAKLRQIFSGSGIRGATYDNIKTQYMDFIEIYRDIDSLNLKLNISDNLITELKKRFFENIFELLTFRIEDKFTIKYNKKPLGDHSLGQRATALILFLLAQRETDVLIIDQPEDDLDNQTIYEDVIKQIKALKGNMQFIFATHNANIPVLGDSEKIISCKYSESKIHTIAGTIDNPETQEQIVTIMEGGQEAFNRRKNIYELWSHKNERTGTS
ncbi:MAG: AAA family ATPase [Candidatus Kuenenia sp.]|nr:AAA family ATPase [Candidatus Kuenenia hertensis]